MSGERSEEGVQRTAAAESDPTVPGSSPTGAPAALTPDDVAYIERWANDLEGAGNDARYTFGSQFVSDDWKRRARLLRVMLATAVRR